MKKNIILVAVLAAVVFLLFFFTRKTGEINPVPKNAPADTVPAAVKTRIPVPPKGPLVEKQERQFKTAEVLRKASDDQAPAIPDICDTSFEDENGNAAKVIVDYGCDGKPDLCMESTFDADGVVIETKSDDGCDGTIDRCSTNERDSYGNVTRFDTHKGACDGPLTSSLCNTYMLDPDGRPLVTKIDFGCKGKEAHCLTTVYDENGRKTESRFDRNCAGKDVSCISFFYDSAGREVAAITDRGCDGSPDSCSYHRYDADGNKDTITDDQCTDAAKYLKPKR